MICPKCDAVNKDNARVCQNCGIRLAGTPMRPGAQKTERRYLAVGTAVALIAVMLFILLLWSFSCACNGCHSAGENAVNEDDGDWSAEVVVSDSSVSGGDLSGTDIDANVDLPVE